MTKILLTRHGHVEGIEPARFRGRSDLALTRRGEAQAEAVAARIASGWRPIRIYTSPARRCIATAAAISKACDIEVQVLDKLNDLDYGAWQSRTYEEIEDADPKLFRTWFATPHLVRFPNGESLQDLLGRTADALRLVLAQDSAATVVVVGHDSVNRALLMQVLDQPQSAYWRIVQDPCCLNEIDVEEGTVRVRRINETSHVQEIEVR